MVFHFSSRKGASKFLSIYWFTILILVAASIYGMVYAYYSHPYDIRVLESEILSNRVADCLYYKGKLNKDLFDDKGNLKKDVGDFFGYNCNFDFTSEDAYDWRNVPQYYVNAIFYEVGVFDKPILSIAKGNDVWATHCEIQEAKEFKRLVRCSNKRFYAAGIKQSYAIEILSVVRKTEKNVKI